jgi:hypothetical protein
LVTKKPNNYTLDPENGVALTIMRSYMWDEQHFSVQQVSSLWGLSQQSIRRLFEDEPDVLVMMHEETRNKRAYSTLRIPESAMKRVQARMANKPTPKVLMRKAS